MKDVGEKVIEEAVHISINSISLEGMLGIPHQAKCIVIFAHGSGSGRLSPRNNFVAQVLRQSGIATLLFDLLTEEEDTVYENRFNIDLLTERLILATNWLKIQPKTKSLTLGYFGASTGTAAAIKAAARLGSEIIAMVSRGGRPDLAKNEIKLVQAPTLLIVGENDLVVMELNRHAYNSLKSVKRLEIVPGATHLFEEPGALEEVSRLASGWFSKYLEN